MGPPCPCTPRSSESLESIGGDAQGRLWPLSTRTARGGQVLPHHLHLPGPPRREARRPRSPVPAGGSHKARPSVAGRRARQGPWRQLKGPCHVLLARSRWRQGSYCQHRQWKRPRHWYQHRQLPAEMPNGGSTARQESGLCSSAHSAGNAAAPRMKPGCPCRQGKKRRGSVPVVM